jgi:hypothetical protein
MVTILQMYGVTITHNLVHLQDLACGVLDLKDEAAVAAAQQAMAAGGDPLGLQGLVDAADDDTTSSDSSDHSQGSHESMGVDDDDVQGGESAAQQEGHEDGQSPRDGSNSGSRRRLRAKRHAGIVEMDAGG